MLYVVEGKVLSLGPCKSFKLKEITGSQYQSGCQPALDVAGLIFNLLFPSSTETPVELYECQQLVQLRLYQP